ncbi:DNA alkylation repair protein [Nesterenkonia ebinurensis]|uniref:DNA alkylation repair protein n=1 Tax=Nesterenkonia ebinurensis TaxID=2608252 RepID=UPI00123D0D86|nr:DNA alkylation repair protein [Nesterenkonia ebinurensis]
MSATSGTEEIYARLNELRSETEHEKITRRLPAESGMEAVGVRMKDVFDTAKAWTELPVAEVPDLLASRWYEVRMVAVAILDFKARRRLTDAGRGDLYDTYMDNHHRITAWDLVDRAAPRVVGWYLLDKSREPIFELAGSDVTLERRTAITAAFWIIRAGDLDDPLALAEMLLDDDSELVTKPVGTALREVGKIDQDRMLEFLRRHRERIPRATLRLATNGLPDELRAALIAQ